MVLLFLLFFAGSAGGQEEFLHKTPSTELEKLFTHGPFDYEVRLNFNIDSQEDSHNEIRRSVPEVRTDLGTIALAELQKIQEGSRSIRSSVGPSFGQATYDFLVPAGKHENSSILAILKFSTPDISPVNFTIAMDRLHWFRIGEVRQGQNGDKINYEIQILHAAGVDVRPELTKNSVYKFNIEATQGQTKISSRVRVEVFSFSPTTRRIKTTTEGVTASTEVIEGSGTEPLVLEVEKTTTSTEIGTTTSSQKSTLPTNLSTSTISSAEMDNMSLVTTKTLANNATKSSFLPGSTMFDDQLLSTTIHPKKKGELKRKKPKKPVEEVEGSGEPENSVEKEISTEQDDEDPLSEVVTIATPILQKETIKGIDIDITGVENGVFELKGQLNRGDLLRGLVISAKIKSEDTEWLKLSIDRPEFFSVRPGRVEPGGKAYLFCNHPDLVGDIQLKITISDGPVIEEEIITIRHNKPKEDNSTMKIDFSVSEDASSGAIVGQLKNGNDFKIVGKSGLFALVGDSLVLSCSSEAPCLDYESQHVHYLLLVAKDGSLKTMKVAIQVLDVNDNTPLIEITDAVIRVSDGQLIMPFAVQIEDEDTPAVQQNELSTSGEAANFLELEKVDVDLYQIHVKGSPSPGRYELILRVDDGVHHSRKTHKTVKVLVQNSHSHAHFRRTIYVRNVTPERILPEVEVLRVELEGIPIDEAKFVILNGNPGWLTIDDYGGAISFTRPDRKPVTGKYETAIAALNRETGKILAQTTLSITVLGIAEERKVFMKSVYEKTVDRETSEGVFISLGTSSPFEVEASSLLGIDENGLRKELTSEAISIRGDKVSLSKEAIATLRVIRMVVVSGKEKATVIFHLTSSNSYLEHRRKMASRPLLPALPEILEVAEELPNGHVIMTLPAVHPLTGKVLPIKLEADERDGSFTLDSATGALKVARRMDYDDPATPKKIELKVIAGEEGYETTAKMRMKLVDVDDNPPVIMREGLTGKIVIPENLPIDTVILRVPVSDIDETSIREGLTSKIQGNSASLFKTMISNGTAIIQVAEELDREKTAQHVIQLIVEDQAGQRDSVSLTVELSDVNDNAPKFTREVYDVQAVENWPAGIILETLRATDRDFDSMKRNRVSYKLENLNSKYFSLDSTTGELHIGQDLMGLAREEPYVLTAVATDAGSPPLNSSVMVRITVSEPKKANLSPLKFLSPPMDYKKAYILELMGPLQPNDKVYQAKARAEGDGRNVKYTMKELFMDESLFNIDEMTGEVMVKKGLEKKGEHILLISANHLHSGVETTRLLRIRYTPSTRSSPYFPEGSPFYYRFRRLKSLGTIQAGIEDNGEIFYYLIPSCSPQTSFFSLNATTGELFHSGPESPKMTRVELCVLASNEALSETASLSFNRIRKDNVIIQIVTEHDDETFEPEMGSINNTVITLDDRKMSRSKIVVGEDELSSFYNFSITSVTFLPSETVLPLSTAAPLPSLFSVGPRGIVRPSPTLSTQPSGIYIVKVEAQDSSGDKEDLTQEFHLIAKTSRLRFIVEKPLIPMAKEFPAFEKELKKTLQLSGEKVLRLVLDQPKMVAGNASRSSICFHAVGNDSLLSPQTAIVFLGKIGELFQVYNNFGVIDIAISCIEPTIVEEPISEVLTSPTSLFIISVLAFSILFFFLIFVYFCFIQRYRDYLIGKQKAMQGPPQAVVPSTPTFVLTPPMAHIQPPLGYWE